MPGPSLFAIPANAAQVGQLGLDRALGRGPQPLVHVRVDLGDDPQRSGLGPELLERRADLIQSLLAMRDVVADDRFGVGVVGAVGREQVPARRDGHQAIQRVQIGG